jgi:hypothetical protein
MDTWHMADKVMACRGSADDQDGLSVLGSFRVVDRPDWGWRILINPGADQTTLRIAMITITPDGQEYPAVEGVYARA